MFKNYNSLALESFLVPLVNLFKFICLFILSTLLSLPVNTQAFNYSKENYQELIYLLQRFEECSTQSIVTLSNPIRCTDSKGEVVLNLDYLFSFYESYDNNKYILQKDIFTDFFSQRDSDPYWQVNYAWAKLKIDSDLPKNNTSVCLYYLDETPITPRSVKLGQTLEISRKLYYFDGKNWLLQMPRDDLKIQVRVDYRPENSKCQYDHGYYTGFIKIKEYPYESYDDQKVQNYFLQN